MNDNISDKDPIGDAHSFAKVHLHNYLAHSIREIEHIIHQKKRISYHITVKITNMVNNVSNIFFYKSGCTIFLPDSCPDINKEDIRLILAHELGHISYNINEIESQNGYNVLPPDAEEYYAWKFAYSMLDAKSDSYKKGIGTDEYIYPRDDLAKLLMRNVKKQCPEQQDLHNKMRQFLKV